jgi:hypothetical protein
MTSEAGFAAGPFSADGPCAGEIAEERQRSAKRARVKQRRLREHFPKNFILLKIA